MAIDIASMVENAIKDSRSSGSRTSSAWGGLALTLAGAAGAVGIEALARKAGDAGVSGATDVTKNLKANQGIVTPGQPTQKASATAINKSAVIVGVLVLALGTGAVWFAFKG